MNRFHVSLHAASVLTLGGLMFLIGCSGGPKAAANSVKGKISVGGNPVSGGSITFHGSKDVMAPILNGDYKIEDPPLGQVKVSIKGVPGQTETKKELPGGVADPKGAGTLLQAGPGAGGVAPPKKYEDPENGLTYEVKAGKHEKNFELEP